MQIAGLDIYNNLEAKEEKLILNSNRSYQADGGMISLLFNNVIT